MTARSPSRAAVPGTAAFDVVIPSMGRPELETCLLALACGTGPAPQSIVVVDDRPEGASGPLVRSAVEVALDGRLRVVRPARPGRGPAAARNAGWRACAAGWVCFLDDDVVPAGSWRADLAAELEGAGEAIGGIQGRIRVPLPRDRRPTDWERQVAGLADARWATADMAFRRVVLEATGGFDERFPRAFREDADLALRVENRGWLLATGERCVTHPVLDVSRWVSLRRQKGNADDPLMAALHGAGWRVRAQAPPGRLRRHVVVTAAGLAAVVVAARGRRRAGAVLAAGWVAGTAEFAWLRIAPGPRTREEVGTMVLTSAAIPPLATGWHLVGRVQRRARRRQAGPEPLLDVRGPIELGFPHRAAVPGTAARDAASRDAAVLFDRDGTIVVDVPYNGDPARVLPVPGAREAIERLRAAGLKTGIVSNQSGIARGVLTPDQVDATMNRVDELLGPFGTIVWCPHGPADGCRCRKPRPGLVEQAARQLGVRPDECVVIGDIGADVAAAHAAGAWSILVANPRTRRAEVDAAPTTAATLAEAVDLVLAGLTPLPEREEAAA